MITFSVPIAGVLLVFSFLVVPAAIAFQFTRRQGALAAISLAGRGPGLGRRALVSFRYDLPTGPVIVCMFGVVLLAAYGLRRALGRVPEASLQPVPEQGWLDALPRRER